MRDRHGPGGCVRAYRARTPRPCSLHRQAPSHGRTACLAALDGGGLCGRLSFTAMLRCRLPHTAPVRRTTDNQPARICKCCSHT
jgi:hypothetical protein